MICNSENRFVGYDPEAKSLDADKLRQYIFGGHVANYMRYLTEEDEEEYKKCFSRYIKFGVAADDVSKSIHVFDMCVTERNLI